LLGLLREEEGVAARVLVSLGVSLEEVREQVARIVGSGDEVTGGTISFTPRAKKVLELALREALSLGHNYIGTEHILLAVAFEGEGVAVSILHDFDVDAEKIRNELVRMLPGMQGPTSPKTSTARRREAVRRTWMTRRATDEAARAAARRAEGELSAMKASVSVAWIGGLVIAAVGFPLGILVGWLIWG
jgi:ATP-dependent Clp protease ATP-binding subunit ClpA